MRGGLLATSERLALIQYRCLAREFVSRLEVCREVVMLRDELQGAFAINNHASITRRDSLHAFEASEIQSRAIVTRPLRSCVIEVESNEGPRSTTARISNFVAVHELLYAPDATLYLAGSAVSQWTPR